MAEKELIRDLTPEQESLLDVYYKKGLAWGLDCSPSNRPVAEEAIKSLYKKSGHAEPKFFWVNSQHEALALYRKESGHPQALLPTPYSGQHEGSWVAWWKYYQEVLKAEVDPDAEDLHDALNTVARPLNRLSDSELTPGSAALAKVNARLR